jgi:carbamoylphosphate synthase large subunit
VSADGPVREQGLALLKALKWHGVAMVEFRLRPDGTPVFLEVNGRFWTSLALAVHAGADFPVLLAKLAGTFEGSWRTRNRRRQSQCRVFFNGRALVSPIEGGKRSLPTARPGRPTR